MAMSQFYDPSWRGGAITREDMAERPDFVPAADRPDVLRHLAESGCSGRFKLITGDGPQDRCRCADCGAYIYCVSKAETGKPVRQVKNRDGLKFGTRERILQRDGAQCALCLIESPGIGGWHIGHVVSVHDCKSYGFEAEDYNHDHNLCVLCEPCNLGIGSESMMIRPMIRLFLRHNRAKRGM